MRSNYCGKISSDQLGKDVQLCGWIMRRRDHGGVIFLDVRDRYGIAQVVCDPDFPKMFQVAEKLRNEFCIQFQILSSCWTGILNHFFNCSFDSNFDHFLSLS